MKNLHHLSATQIRDAFVRGEIKATQIAAHFLERILKHNQELGAFLHILEPQALQKAEELDRKRAHNKPLGKMAGIPIGIKDNMHISTEITSCASRFMQNYRAPFSATAVRLLEEEDALLIGKTNLDEFAMGSTNGNSAFFPVQNPWDLSCVPGGSSGGSAAAVAARLCPIATGTDTGGSIRQPASFCGIVGYKPTYGRVSRYGLVAFGSSLDQIGPMTCTVKDAALTMEVIGRPCRHDATCLDLPAENYLLTPHLKELKLGVPWHLLENLKPEIRANFEEALAVYKSLGAEIVSIDLDILKYSMAVYYIIATAEASTNLARLDGLRYGVRPEGAKTLEEIYERSRAEGFGPEVKRRILLGSYVLASGYQEAFYKKALKVRTLMLDAFDTAFAECDAVAMPVTPTAAFGHNTIHDPLEMYLQDIFTIPANLAGLPAISLPSGYDQKGMPLGLQLMGPQMCDVLLLQYAYAYEQATSHLKIPPKYH